MGQRMRSKGEYGSLAEDRLFPTPRTGEAPKLLEVFPPVFSLQLSVGELVRLLRHWLTRGLLALIDRKI